MLKALKLRGLLKVTVPVELLFCKLKVFALPLRVLLKVMSPLPLISVTVLEDKVTGPLKVKAPVPCAVKVPSRV